MPNISVLNNVDHRDLRIITTRSARLGDSVNCAITFPWEFRNVQAHYPIFFSKDPGSGEFGAVAVLGFVQGENLFLSDEGWDAGYVPLTIERQPFLIGFKPGDDTEDSDTEALIHVDLDSPRVSQTEGERVFMEHGGLSEYLQHMNSVLETIRRCIYDGKAFAAALQEHDLLESFALEIELNDGSQNRLMGYYTIDEKKLLELDATALGELHERGYLQAIYMVVASLSNIRDLIDRRNALLPRDT